MFEIPLSETTLGEEEVAAATRVLRSKWLTMGEEVLRFEEEFAAALGARHAVAVANGTLALELAYRAAGLQTGDEVILPAITFVACFNAARLCGARVVLADVISEDDWTICPKDVERKLTAATRLVVPMAHSGTCPDMQALHDLCADRGMAIVEDSCHAPLAMMEMDTGAGPQPRCIGTIGLMGAWSFFGNKNMTTGEGGMITTNHDAIAARLRLMRSHGITRSTWDRREGHAFSYDVAEVGTNARLDEIRAAIGREQLRKLPVANAARASASAALRAALSPLERRGLRIPFAKTRGTSSHHLFCVLLPEATDRPDVMTHLKECGIQSSIHYPPLHGFGGTRRYFEETGGAAGLDVTDRIAGRIVTLPLFPGMTDAQVGKIAGAMSEALGG